MTSAMTAFIVSISFSRWNIQLRQKMGIQHLQNFSQMKIWEKSLKSLTALVVLPIFLLTTGAEAKANTLLSAFLILTAAVTCLLLHWKHTRQNGQGILTRVNLFLTLHPWQCHILTSKQQTAQVCKMMTPTSIPESKQEQIYKLVLSSYSWAEIC